MVVTPQLQADRYITAIANVLHSLDEVTRRGEIV